MTKVITVDTTTVFDGELEEAAAVLRSDGLVAFPTETVYGLGAIALSAKAVNKIYTAKGRPATNPLILHVASIDAARQLAMEWPEAAQRLAEAFWPGPLTLVLKRSEIVPDEVCAGLDTVAIRMPAHPVARRLIELVGAPVAAPSANRYTRVSPTTAQHVLDGLGGRIDLIIDGGPTSVGLESTLVFLAENPPVILRPGMIGGDELRRVIEVERFRPQVVAENQSRASPGLSRRHYSPGIPVRLVEAEEFRQLSRQNRAFIGVGGDGLATPDNELQLPREPHGYAQGLYGALHQLEQSGADEIVVEIPPVGEGWDAIHDRLKRAQD